MTDTVISTSQIYAARAAAYRSAAAGDTLTILPGVYGYGSYDARTDHYGLFEFVNSGRLTNYGTLINAPTSSEGYVGTVSISAPDTATVTVDNYGTISNTSTFIFSSAIYVSNGSTTISNQGNIYSKSTAIYNESGSNTVMNILNTGTISSSNGNVILSAGGSTTTIRNSGTIQGTVFLDASDSRVADTIDNQANGIMTGRIIFGSGANVVTNSGTINGTVFLGDGANTLANHALIVGDVLASGGADSISNDGHITGNIALAAGNDRFVNILGSVTGNVDLGAGNDLYDGSHGVVGGTIAGGLGDDRLTGGDASDIIYGDTVSADSGNGDANGGADTIMAGYGDDIVYGGYGADSLYGNQGDDVLYGNQGDDFIHGGQGDDTLFGGKGADILNGGLGNDTLSGNLGNDSFVFAANFGRDIVTDFGTADGNSDQLRFGAGTFADYADVQAHMVQSGANVVLTLDAGNSITLFNTTTALLTADHFLFG